MPHQELMKKFQAKKSHQLGMGGEKKLEARKAAGKMNARERIDYLFDPGTFQEIGLFTHSAQAEDAESTPTDGKIIGSGLVQGRLAGTVTNDLTVKGASSARINKRKMEYMRFLSCEKGMPLEELAGWRMNARITGAVDAVGETEREILDACKERLASFKKPKSVEFIKELPQNAYGKILRRVLKEPYWKGHERKVN